MDETTRKGRYCGYCSGKVSTKAGVEVKSRQKIMLEEEKAQEAAQYLGWLDPKGQQASPQTQRVGKSGGMRYKNT